MAELEPCPCCGGEARLKDVHGTICHGWVGCPECGLYINWNISPSGAIKTWNRRTQVCIEQPLFDREEIFPDCTVQVLTNTATGRTSVGWWENKKGDCHV